MRIARQTGMFQFWIENNVTLHLKDCAVYTVLWLRGAMPSLTTVCAPHFGLLEILPFKTTDNDGKRD